MSSEPLRCPKCRVGELGPETVECPNCGYSLPKADTMAIKIGDELEESIRKQLGRDFQVERLLGKGGMSVVYLARELELNRLCAVKVLPLQLSFSADAADRFKREAKIAASLDHPHIVPVHRVGATPAFLWYSMKYVTGQTLAQVLRQTPQLEMEVALSILEQAASALHYAHKRGVIHRDMKPPNIMVDEDGWAMVCDFGVAKAFGSLPLTQTGSTLGTPSYMSPEQCYGRVLDGRSDQYALGVVAYECLAGRPPFVADSIGEYVRLHCTEPPPPLEEFRPDVAPEVAAAIRRALSKGPEDRFDTVLDFVAGMGGRAVPTLPRASVAVGGVPQETAGKVTPETPPPFRSAGRRGWSLRRRIGGYATAGLTLLLFVLALPGPQAESPADSGAAPPAGAAEGRTNDVPPATDEPAPSGGSAPSTTSPTPAPRTGSDARRQAPLSATRLYISTIPLGDLYIDGRRVGASFIPEGVVLAPGTHTIRVTLDGYEPYEQTVDIAAGQPDVRLTGIQLKKLPG